MMKFMTLQTLQSVKRLKTVFLIIFGIIFGCLVSRMVYAENASTYLKSGFYAGVQAGVDDTSYSASDVFSEAETATDDQYISPPGIQHAFSPPLLSRNFVINEINDKGMAGRIYGGYQFNPYFAIETGFTQFHKTDFTGTGTVTPNPIIVQPTVCQGCVAPTEYSSTVYQGEINENAIDLVGKATLPLRYGFGVYVKAGLAYIAANEHINSTNTYTIVVCNVPSTSTTQNVFLSKSSQAIRPTYGIGLSYTIPTSAVNLDASFMQIMGGGNIPKANLIALGLSEKFA